jgi:hypothetical protein
MEMLAGGAPPGAEAAPEGEPAGDAEESVRSAIDLLKEALANPVGDDDVENAIVAKVIAELSKMLGDMQDTQVKALGGEPKQMRAMGKAYASGQ